MPADKSSEAPVSKPANEQNPWVDQDRNQDAHNEAISSFTSGANGASSALALAREEAFGKRPERMSYTEHLVDKTAAVFLPETSSLRQGLVTYVPETARMASFLAPGLGGALATVGLSMANQMSPQDSLKMQALDGMAGLTRGLGERGIAMEVGKLGAGRPVLAAVAGGLSFRSMETLTNRENYLDSSGNLDVLQALERTHSQNINNKMIAADAVLAWGSVGLGTTFAQNWLKGRLGSRFDDVANLMPQNSLVRHGLAGVVVGTYSGGIGEMERQVRAGSQEIDYSKVFQRSAFDAARHGVLGIIGGTEASKFQSRTGMKYGFDMNTWKLNY